MAQSNTKEIREAIQDGEAEFCRIRSNPLKAVEELAKQARKNAVQQRKKLRDIFTAAAGQGFSNVAEMKVFARHVNDLLISSHTRIQGKNNKTGHLYVTVKNDQTGLFRLSVDKGHQSLGAKINCFPPSITLVPRP